MPYSNTAFGPDYEVAFKSGLRARFVGAGECGMGGPIKGTLTIDGHGTISNALRPFYADPRESERFMGYQRLDITGMPRVIVHIVDPIRKDERVIAIPFGAYLFQEITADEFLLLDEFESTTTVYGIDPPFGHDT